MRVRTKARQRAEGMTEDDMEIVDFDRIAICYRLKENTMTRKRRAAAGRPIKAALLHLGYNMWFDWESPNADGACAVARPYRRFDVSLWNDLVKLAAEAGLNTVVIDLGEGVKYDSHPELAVRGSWTPGRLKRELGKLRELGLEPIPKLNFSAGHDHWLGKYSRMVSTDAYYGVCKDLIAEVIDLFDKPTLFHLGMDEESMNAQRYYEYIVIRQYELWWNDFFFFVEQVEKAGARAWVWCDHWVRAEGQGWEYPKKSFEKMPRNVLLSHWYYGDNFRRKEDVQTYLELEKLGYEQVPCGSNVSSGCNLERTVRFCTKHVSAKRLLGFLHAPWQPTVEAFRAYHIKGMELAGRAFGKWPTSGGR